MKNLLYDIASAFLLLVLFSCLAAGFGLYAASKDALQQANDRAMITPAEVFYEQLQARRKAGTPAEAEYRTAVDELLEKEIRFRNLKAKT